MAEDRFGNIKIDRGTSGNKAPEVPLEKDIMANDEVASSKDIVSSPIPGSEKHRRKTKRTPSFEFPVPSRKVVAWLLVIPLIVLLYGVGSYFLVPFLVKEFVVSKLRRDFERPVQIARVVFSPFNLQLLINEVSVGPQHGDVSAKDFLSFERGSFHFTLKKIYRGKIVCSRAMLDEIEMNLVRQRESTVDLKTVSDIFLSYSMDQKDQYWPGWFAMDEVTVSNGRVNIDDRIANKVYTIEQVQFFLPSSKTREREQTAVPKLSAIVDSSPFEINAVRLQNQSGEWSIGFSFEFKSVMLNRFRDILPFPDSGLQLADGEADMALDFILPEIQHETEGIVIEGETSLKNIQWLDPETQSVISVPEGKVVYRIEPSEKMFRFIKVEFQNPQIVLKEMNGSSGQNPLEYMYSVVNKIFHADEIMMIENFLLRGGKIVMPGENKEGLKNIWSDVSLNLSGFTTAGHRLTHPSEKDPLQYTLAAKDIKTSPVAEMYTKGEMKNDGVLKGQLTINGLDMSRYASFFPKNKFTLQKGNTDISFHYEYRKQEKNKPQTDTVQNRIYSGKFKTSNFVLNRKKQKAATGDTLSCGNFHMDMNTKSIVCELMELSQGEVYFDNIVNSAAKKGDWKFLVKNLKVSDSTLHMPLKKSGKRKKGSGLTIKKLNLEASSLQSENVAVNIKMNGRLGKKGNLAVLGSFSQRTGKGSLTVDAKNIHLSLLGPYYSSWFLPKVTKGTLFLNGTVQLPAKEYKGKVQVDDFDTEKSDGAALSWKKMYSNDVVYKAKPFMMKMNELVFSQPSVQPGLSTGEGPLSNFLKFKNSALPPSVDIGIIRLEDGSFGMPEPVVYPGYQPTLKNMNGTVSLSDNNKLAFIVDGKVEDKGLFKIQGSGSLNDIWAYELEANNISLLPFDSVLKREAGFSGKGSLASWKQKLRVENSLSKVDTQITIKNATPDFSSPASSIVSMLINQDNSFEMDLAGEYSPEKSQPFLLEQLITRLRHFQVKASLSPDLIMQTINPYLKLVSKIDFIPGQVELEKNVSFEGYRELLARRPYIMLNIQGQYDPVADHDVIHAQMQGEADKKREEENKRRALEKDRLLQNQQKILQESKVDDKSEVIEEVITTESEENMQPLPKVIVKVRQSILTKLAEKRAQTIHDHLVKDLNFDSSRVMLDPIVTKGSSSIKIQILPYESKQ